MKMWTHMGEAATAKTRAHAPRINLMEQPGHKSHFAIMICLVDIKILYADVFGRYKAATGVRHSGARQKNREKPAASPGFAYFISVLYLMQAFFDMPASRISGALCWMALNSS